MSKKQEQVSISFHYITRRDQENKTLPFTNQEFQAIIDGPNKLKTTDNSQDRQDILRYNKSVIVKELEKLKDERTICGIFENSYSGHSYRNSEKGDITANSLNFRPFFFLMYLSESGTIYIATQYLGHYGGYTALKNTIETLIINKQRTSFHSFNMSIPKLEEFVPQEVVFDICKQSDSISRNNLWSSKMAVAFKAKNKETSAEYQEGVRKSIFPLFKKPAEKIIEGINDFLNSRDLISMDDKDIEGCRIIGTVNKKKQTVHILNGINFATKFPLDITCQTNGHPSYEEIKKQTYEILMEQIIARKEGV